MRRMDWAYVISISFPPGDGIDTIVMSLARSLDTELGLDDPAGERWLTGVDGEVWRVAVLTDTPASTFARIRSTVHAAASGSAYRVSYRRLTRHPQTDHRVEEGAPIELFVSPSSMPQRPYAAPFSHQLVVQFPWPDADLASFEHIADLELRIEALLAAVDEGCLDGHDAGSGELNIFILSNMPEQTFHRIQPLIEEWAPRSDVRVAYRRLDDNAFTILWPPGLGTFDVG